MSTVKFNDINIAFDTIAYPFSNVLLGLFVKGTATIRVIKPVFVASTKVKTPVAPVITRVTTPATPTYTRV